MLKQEKMRSPLHLISLFSVFFLFQLNVHSQDLGQSKGAPLESAAAKAAAQDASIVRRVSHITGEVTYYQKSVSPITGKTNLTPVEYCSKTHRFNRLAATGNAPCLKYDPDCRKKTASAAGSSTSTAAKACSPAQKAACSSANSKVAIARKTLRKKA